MNAVTALRDLRRVSLPRHFTRLWVALAGLLEAVGVLLSPPIAVRVLRLRLMAPITMPDPSMHTIYAIDPRQMYVRYAGVIAIGRLREGARVGFLVPARLADLAFGPVHGFFVLRYVFALIAVVPVYLLLRRLYGRAAGLVGIVVVLSSPVLVTAWGTDYPNSAVVSYAAGGLACLAMASAARWRIAWLAAAAVLLTMAVWSHGVAVPLVASTMVAYLGVRVFREPAKLLVDLPVLAAVAAAVTGLLMLASGAMFGHANFIAVTWQGVRFLSQPSQTASWHATNWRWAPHLAYLLVPPAVLCCFVAAFARRPRSIPTPALVVGFAAAAQLGIFAGLEFFWTVQDLELYLFSSTLWAGVCLAFAITVAELARPLSDPITRWLPAAVLLAIPLGYEAERNVPSFGWRPTGEILALLMIAAAVTARVNGKLRPRPLAAAAIGLALAIMAATALVLTVSPGSRPPNTPVDDAPAPYAAALGGGYAKYLDAYRIATELPSFVGEPTYPGEQVVIWYPHGRGQNNWFYTDYQGIYHGPANRLPNDPPIVTLRDLAFLEARRPAEILAYASSQAKFPILQRLAPLQPTLLRVGELRAGSLNLYVWLIRLGAYYHPPPGTRT